MPILNLAAWNDEAIEEMAANVAKEYAEVAKRLGRIDGLSKQLQAERNRREMLNPPVEQGPLSLNMFQIELLSVKRGDHYYHYYGLEHESDIQQLADIGFVTFSKVNNDGHEALMVITTSAGRDFIRQRFLANI